MFQKRMQKYNPFYFVQVLLKKFLKKISGARRTFAK